MTFHAANAISKRDHTKMFTITVQSPNPMQCYNLCTCTRCLLMSVNAEELNYTRNAEVEGISNTWCGHVELWHIVGGGGLRD